MLYKKGMFILILVGTIFGKTYAQENRFVSLSYVMRFNFRNFDNYTGIQDGILPKLSNNARFHGMKIEAGITENIIIGLYVNGGFTDASNDTGYTSWGGALGVVTVQYRYHFSDSFFGSFGMGLGCGRFTYQSSYWNGDKSIISHNDKIFFEPLSNIGYMIPKAPWQFILSPEVSYIINLNIPGLSNGYYMGDGNKFDAFPHGWFVGGSFGYKFPIIK